MYKEKAKEALKAFVDFLSNQTKIIFAEDLIQSIIYTYTSSIPGCAYRCNLWTGLTIGQRNMIGGQGNYDAQINISIAPAEIDNTYNFIAYHKPNKRLSDPNSWYF